MERNERFASLLRDSAPAGELLSWREVEQLVAAAPPVRRPWYSRFAASPAPLRYALAPFALLFMLTIALGVMPAQSMQVGTMVYTSLPAAWETDSAAFAEFQAQAGSEFTALRLRQGSLRLFVAELAGRDQLVFTMLEADRAAAEGVMRRLNARYPMLAAFPQDYVDMRTDPSGSRLTQLAQQVQHGASRGLDETQVAQQVLGALHSAGLSGLEVRYETLADGSLAVTIEGEFSMQVPGHSQETPAPAGGPADTAEPAELLRMLGAAPN